MTREEKINTLKAIIQECEEYQWQRKETLFEIIKDLEQETVSKEVYDHEYFLRKEFEIKIDKLQRQLEEQAVKAEAILGKIRAEIKQLPTTTCSETYIMQINTYDFKENVIAIIDKYRAENEDKE